MKFQNEVSFDDIYHIFRNNIILLSTYMKKGLLFLLLSLFAITILSAQSIEKKWILENVEGTSDNVFKPGDNDYLNLEEGLFSYKLNNQLENLKGDYFAQNNVLLFFPDNAEDSIIKYKIQSTTDSTLVLSKKDITYSFISNKKIVEVAPVPKNSELIPNQGFSFSSFWRGVLGMIVLLAIAFLFSSNRKAINWKTVGLGVGFQLIIAIGVFKSSICSNDFWMGRKSVCKCIRLY